MKEVKNMISTVWEGGAKTELRHNRKKRPIFPFIRGGAGFTVNGI
jgi:hypothetical protein